MDNATTGDMTIISCNELVPGLGVAYFLRNENDKDIEIERVLLLSVGGVNPPASVAPFVMELKIK
jgi:hypothetical protein